MQILLEKDDVMWNLTINTADGVYKTMAQGSILCCCWLPTPLTLANGRGQSNLPAYGQPASFSIHLARSAMTSEGSILKSMENNVVPMWVKLKRCWRLVVMNVNWHRLCVCKYDLRKGDLFVLSWARVSVWWR